MQTSPSPANPLAGAGRQHLVKCQLGINRVATTTGGYNEQRRRYSHSYLTRNNHKISQSFSPQLYQVTTHAATPHRRRWETSSGSDRSRRVRSALVLLRNYLMGFLQRAHLSQQEAPQFHKFSPIPRVHHEFHYAVGFQLVPAAQAKDAISRARTPPLKL